MTKTLRIEGIVERADEDVEIQRVRKPTPPVSLVPGVPKVALVSILSFIGDQTSCICLILFMPHALEINHRLKVLTPIALSNFSKYFQTFSNKKPINFVGLFLGPV